MQNLTKGQLSRQKIIRESRDVFNKKGIQITIQELAIELGEGVSYITNHYRTKDHLIVAIANDYEDKFYEFLKGLNEEFSNLKQLAQLISSVMDLQYDYRCAILAIVASRNSQKVLFKQVQESYQKNLSNFAGLVKLLVSQNILKKEALAKEELGVIRFQYVNLHTTWVVSLELYDHPVHYKKMKALYLRGIVSTLLPYLTVKGAKQFKSIDFRKFK